MDDPQRQPKDSDRSAVAGRIKRASDQGRISGADRDIRLGNVWNAQSMAELDLMTRELDQLDATPSPQAAPTPVAGERPWSTFQPGVSDPGDHPAGDAASVATAGTTGSRSRGATVAVLVAIGVVVAVAVAAVALFVSSSGTGDDGSSVEGTAPTTPVSVAPTTPVSVAPTTAAPEAPSGASYALTGPGIRAFLQTYQQRFGTSLVVDLTLYGDYAIVNVPVPGKARQSGWLYRDGRWSEFGGVRAVFPGARPLDTNRLAVPALVRNIARARATLDVEKPSQTYVILRSIDRVDEVPSVDVHVSNQFRESGYLATRLDGTVERAFPYGQ